MVSYAFGKIDLFRKIFELFVAMTIVWGCFIDVQNILICLLQRLNGL